MAGAAGALHQSLPAGGPTDTLSRLLCASLSEITGQQFVVDNLGVPANSVPELIELLRRNPKKYI